MPNILAICFLFKSGSIPEPSSWAMALKTSDQEKIKGFKNAILNTALAEAPDKNEMFVKISSVCEQEANHTFPATAYENWKSRMHNITGACIKKL